MFKRRDRRPVHRIVLEALWPRGGWARASRYVRHRIRRLPDPPERIARGIFAGVFTTFTPFYGLHFMTAALIAFVMRGNILAALLSTFFGNPLTYVPIGVSAMTTGYWLLGIEGGPESGGLGRKFGHATRDLWHNVGNLLTGRPTDWSGLSLFYDEVFFPYLIGGILPGLLTATVCYYLSLPMIRVYQNRRKGVIAAKLAAMKKKKADAAAAREAASSDKS